ncbi:MAG TPA: hypothetical protein VGB09_08575 [Candidatus Binatia bacterium]
MQNLAYKIDVLPEASRDAGGRRGSADVCAACGEQLFGPDAGACSWQAWGSFWEIMGMSNVELVCGACGEYLQGFFKDRR